MLTQKELLDKFNTSLVQYLSTDKYKHDQFSLIQGFLGVKVGNKKDIIPFVFYNKKSFNIVLNTVKKLKADYLGISFVQHYIHYS